MAPPTVLIATDEEKDKEIAKLKAQHEKDEKKAKAMDEEHDESKKAEMEKDLKALEEVFETGNGVNTNAQETEEEKEKTAVIAALTAKVARPIINEILTAKTNAGATEDQIKEETKRLTAMTLPEVEVEYKANEVFIKQALAATAIEQDSEALSASFEKEFEFNGVNGLTAKVTDIDEILEQVTQ